MINNNLTIELIEIKLHFDEITDIDNFDGYDKSAIDAFYNDDWRFIGIEAISTISYPINDVKRLDTLSSGGLWSIDYRYSIEDYHKDIMREQLEDLKNHLNTFNVNTDNFDMFVENAINNADF